MRFYDWFMLAAFVAWIATGVAGHREAFLLLAFGLVIVAGLHDWLLEN